MQTIYNQNLLTLTDSYKHSHHLQYPTDVRHVYSFLESRGGKFPTTTAFGLQALLRQYLIGEVVTQGKIDWAERLVTKHMGPGIFNRKGWEYILKAHNGRLPLRIKSVLEGTTVPTHNVLMTVENTDPEVPWLTNFVETLLMQVWYPITVATQSREMKKIILEHLRQTGDPSLIDFKLHDFGFRGSTSVESSAIGGAAHLVNFKGTDTMSALTYLHEFYFEDCGGFSIPAAEHSTITSWGRDHEVDAFRNMLEQFPTGLVAVVSDSFDIYSACRDLWGSALKDKVLERDGVLVVRPDSGHPPTVVCEVLRHLGEAFGVGYNDKGARLLHPKVRVIQGDGIDINMLGDILSVMKTEGWSADNIAFGSGGGLLQKVDRDTCKFAFKCSAVDRAGVWHGVMKDPITDPGKTSKAGRMWLVKDEHQNYRTSFEHSWADQLFTVFENGQLTNYQTFDQIRKRAEVGL